MHSIALLTCWYGAYPWYFRYFIKSCTYNPTIDFIIITDNQEPIPNKPNNVKIVHKTLADINALATKKLGFAINVQQGFKLCDLRPAYGVIFSNIIKGYNFWGHADIDVVYGNIRHFITNEMLNKYDVISSRHDYTTGAL